jgi:hypothetical protein
MTTNKNADRSYAYNVLVDLPEGTEIQLIVRHVARNGMSRVIDALVIDAGVGRPVYLRSLANDFPDRLKMDRTHDGFKVNGTGMDMGWHLVETIADVMGRPVFYFRHHYL